MAGFAVALSWKSLLYCFIGCLWGTVVGVLPGLGPLAGMTLLLPLTFGLDPAIGIIMLTGIFYGAMYGGSTTSILVRIPGEAASVVTCIDGYEMARQGRAGPALMIAAVGSFIGGTVSILGLMFFAPPLAKAMVQIGPSVEFVLMLLALGVISVVSAGSRLKTATMIVLGLAVGTVGLDRSRARRASRSAISGFADGLTFAALAIGLFGVSEILLNLEQTRDHQGHPAEAAGAGAALERLAQGLRRRRSAAARSSASSSASSRASATWSRRSSPTPSRSASPGSRRSSARARSPAWPGPETANNATTGTAMIPLLALGIPSIPATAILLSALTIHGVQPGPLLLTDHPEVFWGLVASMYIGNVDAADPEPAARRPVREPAAHSLCLAGAHHPGDLDRSASTASASRPPTSGSWSCRAASATCCASSATKWRRCCSRSCWATGWRRISGSR